MREAEEERGGGCEIDRWYSGGGRGGGGRGDDDVEDAARGPGIKRQGKEGMKAFGVNTEG